MAKCIYCGQATMLHINGVPVCIECAKGLEEGRKPQYRKQALLVNGLRGNKTTGAGTIKLLGIGAATLVALGRWIEFWHRLPGGGTQPNHGPSRWLQQ